MERSAVLPLPVYWCTPLDTADITELEHYILSFPSLYPHSNRTFISDVNRSFVKKIYFQS